MGDKLGEFRIDERHKCLAKLGGWVFVDNVGLPFFYCKPSSSRICTFLQFFSNYQQIVLG